MEKRIWFITGISSGLGEAIANEVLQNGDFVIGTFRKESQVKAFNLKNKGKGFSYQLDITNEQSITDTITNVESDFGGIDVLVNNAGVGFIGAIEETSIKEARLVFEANFFGTLQVTQKVLPLLRKQKSGHIIQISSHGGLKAFAGFGIYNASKFALEGFSEALAQEVAPLGIKLTIVEPGPFRTKFANTSLIEAKVTIDDYSNTAGNFRNKLKSVDGKQEGDPQKAAIAIFNLVTSNSDTLRLPLGKTALVTIGMKLESVKNDLDAGRQIAEDAVY